MYSGRPLLYVAILSQERIYLSTNEILSRKPEGEIQASGGSDADCDLDIGESRTTKMLQGHLRDC